MANLSFMTTPSGIRIAVVAVVVSIAGCGGVPKWNVAGKKSTAASGSSGSIFRRGGGYYLDDGPGDNPPADLDSIPDAIPRDEPLRPANMRPYVALGKSYTPKTSHESYRERGIASWYGRRYHGQKTASGEIYDMYGMTAAHTTLPLPSYVRVTNIANGKSIVVRVNDRGPFLSDRLIDLSYTAAYKLDVLDGGSAWVEVENILPGHDRRDANCSGTCGCPTCLPLCRSPSRNSLAARLCPAESAKARILRPISFRLPTRPHRPRRSPSPPLHDLDPPSLPHPPKAILVPPPK